MVRYTKEDLLQEEIETLKDIAKEMGLSVRGNYKDEEKLINLILKGQRSSKSKSRSAKSKSKSRSAKSKSKSRSTKSKSKSRSRKSKSRPRKSKSRSRKSKSRSKSLREDAMVESRFPTISRRLSRSKSEYSKDELEDMSVKELRSIILNNNILFERSYGSGKDGSYIKKDYVKIILKSQTGDNTRPKRRQIKKKSDWLEEQFECGYEKNKCDDENEYCNTTTGDCHNRLNIGRTLKNIGSNRFVDPELRLFGEKKDLRKYRETWNDKPQFGRLQQQQLQQPQLQQQQLQQQQLQQLQQAQQQPQFLDLIKSEDDLHLRELIQMTTDSGKFPDGTPVKTAGGLTGCNLKDAEKCGDGKYCAEDGECKSIKDATCDNVKNKKMIQFGGKVFVGSEEHLKKVLQHLGKEGDNKPEIMDVDKNIFTQVKVGDELKNLEECLKPQS